MAFLGPLGFTSPLLLIGLLALPVLWFLLRATPPAPVRRRFPGIFLLLGLKDEDAQAERTPWWLLVLRMAALAAAIVGFAGPVLNPDPIVPARGPLLILEDGSWASARDWSARSERIRRALDAAQAAGRPVALLSLAAPPAAPPAFIDAASAAEALPGLMPKPWEPAAGLDPSKILPEGRFDTLWLSDGLDRPERAPFLAALGARGKVTLWQPETPVLALGRAVIGGAGTGADPTGSTAVRPTAVGPTAVRVPVYASAPIPGALDVVAVGPDPSGVERELARVSAEPVSRPESAVRAEAIFDLPSELRNRVTAFRIAGTSGAGTVSLTDDALKRRKVALVSAAPPREGLELLSPLHYLHEALAPSADLIEGTLADELTANPDVIILADIGEVAEARRLEDWVEKGGLLVRFAGPRMAAYDGSADPLLPVPLRAGGRTVSGTMSWGEPRGLAPFPQTSPFAGLNVPQDVTVREQVMADPAPDLAPHVIASLSDGTPLVTRKRLGEGQIVLFHVTANADWSNLPLSGLFPQMLERLSVAARAGTGDEAQNLAGQTWVPSKLIDGFGALDAARTAPGVAGELLSQGVPGPELPPGIYTASGRSVAFEALARGRVLAPARWPADLHPEGAPTTRQMPLKGGLLGVGLLLLLIDILAALALGGRLGGLRLRADRTGGTLGAIALGLCLGLALSGGRASAEETKMPIDRAVAAASNVVLAYMPSGDPAVDRVSMAGLKGLSRVLATRTTVEPSTPMQIDLATDDLALFTFLYWPVTAQSPTPTPDQYTRLNRFLRGGGMILFDTRDADLVQASGATTDAGKRLQALAAPLEIPPLEVIAKDHVLTRSFYLLQDFPGRYDGPIWVEAAPPDPEQAAGMPFRNLNDGVTPVVIGGNDWASAWAISDDGSPMFPVGLGSGGERQRETAYRFGVNLVMHVLTGNYKSDQVHVPALLERLNQ